MSEPKDEPIGGGGVPATSSSGPRVVLLNHHEELPRGLLGYKRAATQKVLAELKERCKQLWYERSSLEEKVRQLEAELSTRTDSERVIGDVLVSARREAYATKEEARETAEATIKAARKQAEKILATAQREALADASAIRAGAEQASKSIHQEAREAKEFVEETKEELSTFLVSALKWYERGISRDGADEAAEPPASGEEQLAGEHAEGAASEAKTGAEGSGQQVPVEPVSKPPLKR